MIIMTCTIQGLRGMSKLSLSLARRVGASKCSNFVTKIYFDSYTYKDSTLFSS